MSKATELMAIPSATAIQGVWGAEPPISKEAANGRNLQRCLLLTLMDYEASLFPALPDSDVLSLALLSLSPLP